MTYSVPFCLTHGSLCCEPLCVAKSARFMFLYLCAYGAPDEDKKQALALFRLSSSHPSVAQVIAKDEFFFDTFDHEVRKQFAALHKRTSAVSWSHGNQRDRIIAITRHVVAVDAILFRKQNL